ncbi:autotransporter-associated beta strand repeat-containing protein, partial [Salmonella enterica]|uniref:autotransporter-associated beta strand repeat-containing protein n=1 Tax=Salmonella enterica TaxID=28901 RepID=UPI00119188F1
ERDKKKKKKRKKKKENADSLALPGSDTYTGGTPISDGTLSACTAAAVCTSHVTNNATLELNTGGDFINNIGGTGRVEKSGDDTLTLSGSNTYTGGTLINGGTLVASNGEALGYAHVTLETTLGVNTGGRLDTAIGGRGKGGR